MRIDTIEWVIIKIYPFTHLDYSIPVPRNWHFNGGVLLEIRTCFELARWNGVRGEPRTFLRVVRTTGARSLAFRTCVSNHFLKNRSWGRCRIAIGLYIRIVRSIYEPCRYTFITAHGSLHTTIDATIASPDACSWLLTTSPSPRDRTRDRMPSSA